MKRLFALPTLVGLAIVIAVGVALRAATIGWSRFSIKHEVDPITLTALGVNIFIAFFLQYYFAARARDDRAEKDILLDNVRDVFNLLRSCRDEVFALQGSGKISVENQKKINRLFRNLSNGLENLQTAIEMSLCKDVGKEWDALFDKYLKYKGSATGKFPHPYDPSDIGYQDQTYRALNKDLHSLAFKINQYR